MDGIGPLSLREANVSKGAKVRISLRECQGRGRGLPEINTIKLSEAMKEEQYKELITSLRNQCYSILKILLPE